MLGLADRNDLRLHALACKIACPASTCPQCSLQSAPPRFSPTASSSDRAAQGMSPQQVQLLHANSQLATQVAHVLPISLPEPTRPHSSALPNASRCQTSSSPAPRNARLLTACSLGSCRARRRLSAGLYCLDGSRTMCLRRGVVGKPSGQAECRWGFSSSPMRGAVWRR